MSLNPENAIAILGRELKRAELAMLCYLLTTAKPAKSWPSMSACMQKWAESAFLRVGSPLPLMLYEQAVQKDAAGW